MPEFKESLSSRMLAELLKEAGAAKLAADTKIHRTQLWRYATGRGKPDAEQVARLHRASDGRVAADGWETLPAAGSAPVEAPLEEPDEESPASESKTAGPAAAAS